MDDKELSLETVKKRVVAGIIALTGRNFVLQGVSFASFLILQGILTSSEYGMYFLVLSVVGFLTYFSDIGLAAALIQKKERLGGGDLKTTFLVQQVLVISLLTLLFFATGRIQGFFHLSSEGVWLLRALGFSLFLSSLKTIPSVLLERSVQFTKLIIPQIAEVIVFNGLLIFLALRGFGVNSFTWSVLARGLVGLVIIYFIQPWRPGFAFSRESLNKLFRFGIPYQANTLLAMVKDDGMTLVLGRILGVSGLGFLGWAKKWSEAPLRFFMDQVIKVTFPAYSRMQDNKEELSRALSKSVFFVSFLVFPSLAGLVLLAPILIEVVGRYQHWKPALLALGLFSVNTFFASFTTPLTNYLNAVGKIKTHFKFITMWTVLSFIFIPPLAEIYGFNGAAFGAALVGVSSLIPVWVITREIKLDFSTSIFKPLVASLGMGLVMLGGRELAGLSLSSFFILGFSGLVVYLILVRLLIGDDLAEDVKKVFVSLGKK